MILVKAKIDAAETSRFHSMGHGHDTLLGKNFKPAVSIKKKKSLQNTPRISDFKQYKFTLKSCVFTVVTLFLPVSRQEEESSPERSPCLGQQKF